MPQKLNAVSLATTVLTLAVLLITLAMGARWIGTIETKLNTVIQQTVDLNQSIQNHHQAQGHPSMIERVDNLRDRVSVLERRNERGAMRSSGTR